MEKRVLCWSDKCCFEKKPSGDAVDLEEKQRKCPRDAPEEAVTANAAEGAATTKAAELDAP